MTVPRDLEFCTNVRHPCDTFANEAEVRSKGPKINDGRQWNLMEVDGTKKSTIFN